MLLKMMEWPGCPPVYPAAPNNRFLAGEKRPNTRFMSIRLRVQGRDSNEFGQRFVLPTPLAFGTLTGVAEPSTSVATATFTSGIVSQLTLAPPEEPEGAPGFTGTRREWVTLVTAINTRRRAQVRTTEGDEVPCTGFGSAYKVSERCRADVTYQDGRAVSALFKGWA
jgi:hypothetical protein